MFTVGSSRIRIDGSFTSASASPSRWRMPRENVADLAVGVVVEPDVVEQGVDAVGGVAARAGG